MDKQDLEQQAAEYMRLALPLMNQYGISMTPQNYAVWYEYVAGNNIQLNEIIDIDLAEYGSFSNERTQELYQRFLGPEKEELSLLNQQADLRRLLQEIQNFAQTGANSAADSTEQLTEALARLNLDLTREQIQTIIKDVMDETKSAMSSNQLLTDRLSTALADIEDIKSDIEVTKKQAKLDRLTGLANRKAFDEHIRQTVNEVERSLDDLTIIFCDLDLFRELNSKHGHLVGDQVLKVVANIIKSAVKGRDYVARFGGEEFTITLSNTNLADAKKIAESIRLEIATKKIQRKDNKLALGQITMSFGVAAYCQSEGVESFLQRADRALYQSKRKGRNSISEAHPPIM